MTVHTLQRYCRRVQVAAASEVPRTAPEQIRHAVSPAVVDGKPWWTWQGAADSNPQKTWAAYQNWKASWCTSWESYPLDTWTLLGRTQPDFANLVGSSIDSAHAATLLFHLDDLMRTLESQPVMVCQREDKVLGWVTGSRLHTLSQGRQELMVNKSRMQLRSEGVTHQIRGWCIAADGQVQARSESGATVLLDDNTADALLQFGNYSPHVEVYHSVLGDVSLPNTDQTRQALAFSVNNFRRLTFHTLP